MFKRAIKQDTKLRLAMCGPSGSGKTFTALTLAQYLGGSIALIDTEHGSASKYADLFPQFDVCELTSFHPRRYVEAIAAAANYDVLIVDSFSHAWNGKDGALEQVDNYAKRAQSGNKFAAWRDVTPLHNALVDSLLTFPGHLIVTMRSKTEYVMEEYKDDGGKTRTRPVKVGLAPIQREGVEFEFDVVGDMTLNTDLIVSKTRCSTLNGKIIHEPGQAFAQTLFHWLHGESESTVSEDRSPLDTEESAQSKCDRAKVAREEAGLTTAVVKKLLKQEFQRDTPAELSTQECDRLIDLIERIAQQSA